MRAGLYRGHNTLLPSIMSSSADFNICVSSLAWLQLIDHSPHQIQLFSCFSACRVILIACQKLCLTLILYPYKFLVVVFWAVVEFYLETVCPFESCF